MLFRKLTGISILLAATILLAACNVSEASVAEDNEEMFQEKMVQEKMEPNVEEGDLSIYIPATLDREVVDEFNIEFTRNDQVFLLFLNDQTDYDSEEALLDELMINEEDPITLELDEEDGKFGYLVVAEFDEESYRVVVGYEGAKLTTISSLENVNDDAEMMFDIVKSIER
ncbi:hypothetical protein [Evansella halocellulosilytica]|uniref:hypothetical protein n=1 Tax=Evansella halocellulosilytica TaxID=2011013 RepID=UPI000BB707D0|nr:hypothetical protein [Evansella halocellulosilytica]